MKSSTPQGLRSDPPCSLCDCLAVVACALDSKKLFQLQRHSSETQRPHLPWELCFGCSISLLWTCWAKYTKG